MVMQYNHFFKRTDSVVFVDTYANKRAISTDASTQTCASQDGESEGTSPLSCPSDIHSDG